MSQFTQMSEDDKARVNTLVTGITDFLVNYCYKESMEISDNDGGTVTTTGPVIITAIVLPYNTNAPELQNIFAVDVFTWTLSIVAPELDAAHGIGTSYRLWQTVREYGGAFDTSGYLIGVGYSYNKVDNVLSGEWSLGAIICCKVLAAYYSGKNASYVSSLNKDIDLMTNGVETLLEDVYSVDSNGTRNKAIHYADRRYMIPFGWWSNKNLSLASTAWAIFNKMNFNPFVLELAVV